MSILEEIFAHKQVEVARNRRKLPETELASLAQRTAQPGDFRATLENSSRPGPALIAEIKRRSPSKGLLRKSLDALDCASVYAANGASAISILTDRRYFDGSLQDLKAVSAGNLGVPLLRKDFIFDSYQLLEARQAGASAVLLITAMLESDQLRSLITGARALALAPLIEIHTEVELERALAAGADLIGINNRDLHTFAVNLETSIRLAPLVPPGVLLIAESGIRGPEDVARLAEAGIHAILVGEQLVRAADPGAEVWRLMSATEERAR